MNWNVFFLNDLSRCNVMMSISTAQTVRVLGKGVATGKVDILLLKTWQLFHIRIASNYKHIIIDSIPRTHNCITKSTGWASVFPWAFASATRHLFDLILNQKQTVSNHGAFIGQIERLYIYKYAVYKLNFTYLQLTSNMLLLK